MPHVPPKITKCSEFQRLLTMFAAFYTYFKFSVRDSTTSPAAPSFTSDFYCVSPPQKKKNKAGYARVYNRVHVRTYPCNFTKYHGYIIIIIIIITTIYQFCGGLRYCAWRYRHQTFLDTVHHQVCTRRGVDSVFWRVQRFIFVVVNSALTACEKKRRVPFRRRSRAEAEQACTSVDEQKIRLSDDQPQINARKTRVSIWGLDLSQARENKVISLYSEA